MWNRNGCGYGSDKPDTDDGGAYFDEQFPTVEKEIGEVVLEVKNLSTDALLKISAFL